MKYSSLPMYIEYIPNREQLKLIQLLFSFIPKSKKKDYSMTKPKPKTMEELVVEQDCVQEQIRQFKNCNKILFYSAK